MKNVTDFHKFCDTRKKRIYGMLIVSLSNLKLGHSAGQYVSYVIK